MNDKISMRDLSEALRDNFNSLIHVYHTNDGLEVRDAMDDSVVISSIWRPFDAKDYGVASFNGTFRSNEFNNEFIEACYQSVSEYLFGSGRSRDNDSIIICPRCFGLYNVGYKYMLHNTTGVCTAKRNLFYMSNV